MRDGLRREFQRKVQGFIARGSFPNGHARRPGSGSSGPSPAARFRSGARTQRTWRRGTSPSRDRLRASLTQAPPPVGTKVSAQDHLPGPSEFPPSPDGPDGNAAVIAVRSSQSSRVLVRLYRPLRFRRAPGGGHVRRAPAEAVAPERPTDSRHGTPAPPPR